MNSMVSGSPIKINQIILAGLIAGILTGALSSTPLVGCLCVVWQALGGALALFFYRILDPKTSVLTPVHGLVSGLVSGLIGAVTASAVTWFTGEESFNQAVAYIQSNPNFTQALEQFPQILSRGYYSTYNLFCTLAIYPVLGMAGGLLAISYISIRLKKMRDSGTPKEPPDPTK